MLALKSTLGTVLSPAEVMYTQAVCHFDIIQSNLENRLVHLVELCTKYKQGIDDVARQIQLTVRKYRMSTHALMYYA